MKRNFILSACLLVMLLPIAGQNEPTAPPPPSPELDLFRNDISPQVEMMNRYGTYPVDLSTGLVDISIPLYTIKTPGGLTMPLTLSFHASGLRSNEREGLVGVRWVLGGGGSVSRIIRGYPDMGDRTFNRKVSNPEYRPDFYDLYGATGPWSVHDEANNNSFINGFSHSSMRFNPATYQDTEHDIYSYNLPSGKSGKFIWKATGSNDNEWKGYTMPYEPIKAAPAGITDENGIMYRFGERTFVDRDTDRNITTWHLTSIISQNRQDTILIDYLRCGGITNVREKSVTICDRAHPGRLYMVPGNGSTAYNTDPVNWFLGEKLLMGYYKENIVGGETHDDIPYSIRSIRVRSGGKLVCSVVFTYDKTILSGEIYLKEILVKNSLDQPVRNIQFVIKKNAKGVGFLDKVSFVDSKLTPKEVYTFDYYNWQHMPVCGDGLSYNSDWWGFYSSVGGWAYSGRLDIIPPNGGTISQMIGNGSKNPHFESALTGMLQSIKYPTGGQTNFEYESHSWYDRSKQKQVEYGGLRIKNIINSSPLDKTKVKHYEYETGYVPFYLDPPVNKWIISQVEVKCYYDYSNAAVTPAVTEYLMRTFHSHFPSRYTDLSSNIVCYNQVTEYDKDDKENILGKTVYKYLLPDRESCSRGFYEEVNGYEREFNGWLGFQIRHITPKDFWKKNELGSKIYYKGEKKIKEHLYEYKEFYKESICDLPVYKYKDYNIFVDQSTGLTNGQKEMLMVFNSLNETYAIKHQEYTIGAKRLVKETENTYFDDKTMFSIVKEMEYDPVYLLPVKETVINSDFKRIDTNYKYPFSSLQVYDEDVYDKMVSRNFLTPVIERHVYKGEDFSSIITEYKKSGNGFYPSKATYSDFNTTIVYHNYTSTGRPIYISKNNNTENVVYLWSYLQQYPIAEIKNVTYDELCNALGGEIYIKELASKSVPNTSDYTNIRNIRNVLSHAQITTAEYQPLVGVTKTTDPKGLAVYYDYDALGKLTRSYIILDNKQRTLEQYDYHYINQ